MVPQYFRSHFVTNGDRGSQWAAAIVIHKIYMRFLGQQLYRCEIFRSHRDM
jgi:hypothetical protein